MNRKIAAPEIKKSGEIKPKKQDNNNSTLKLSSTQIRIVKLLLVKPELSFEVEQKAYCRYAADNIHKLRNKGINITTRLVSYTRKDGTVSTVGQYSIDPLSVDHAKRAVSLN